MATIKYTMRIITSNETINRKVLDKMVNDIAAVVKPKVGGLELSIQDNEATLVIFSSTPFKSKSWIDLVSNKVQFKYHLNFDTLCFITDGKEIARSFFLTPVPTKTQVYDPFHHDRERSKLKRNAPQYASKRVHSYQNEDGTRNQYYTPPAYNQMSSR